MFWMPMMGGLMKVAVLLLVLVVMQIPEELASGSCLS